MHFTSPYPLALRWSPSSVIRTATICSLIVGVSVGCGANPQSGSGDPNGQGTGGASGGQSSGGQASGGQTGAGTGGAPTGGTGGAPDTGGAPGGEGGDPGTGGDSATGGGSGADTTPSPGCGKQPTFSGESTHTINVGGANRTYIVRVPEGYDQDNPYRLYVASHPLNGTAAGVASGGPGNDYQYYGLWSRDDNNTIYMSPQGNNNGWFNPGGADEDFIMAVIEKLEDEMCIDSSRIFAGGFSMGGAMSYALACRFPEKFRAAIMHSGGAMSQCNQSNRGPVAFFITHGTTDNVTTYPEYGVPQLNDFAARNGCDPMDMPTPTDPSGNTPVCVDFENCDAAYPTRACIFIGGHTPSPGGERNTWVADETWDFVSQF